MRVGFGVGVVFMAALVCGGVVWGQTVADVSLQPHAAGSVPCASSGDATWMTPAEKSCYQTTPDYAETMAYLNRVQSAAPGQVKIEAFGKTGEGRELDVVVVSRDGVFDPSEIGRAHV